MSGTNNNDINVNVTATTAELNEAMQAAAAATQKALGGIEESFASVGLAESKWVEQTKENLAAASALQEAYSEEALQAAAEVVSSYEEQLASLGLLKAGNEQLAASYAELAASTVTFRSLQEGIDVVTGVNTEMYAASDAAKSFMDNLRYAGLSATEMAINAEAAAAAAAELAAQETAAAEAAAALNAEIYKFSTPVSGLKEIINDVTGVSAEFLSAADSARVFEEALAEDTAAAAALNAEIYKFSIPSSGMRQLINDITGVNTQFLSARDSARVFETELSALEAQGVDTGTRVAEGAENAASGMTHASGATASLTREIIVVGHEALSGRFSRIPGSLMVMAEYMGNVTTATMGLVAALGVAAYAVFELTEHFAKLKEAATDATAAMAMQNPSLGNDTVTQMSQALDRLPGTTAETSAQISGVFAGMRGATKAEIDLMTDDLQAYADGMQEKVPQAAKTMAAALSDPAANGKEFLQSIGASTSAVNQFDEAIQNNDVVTARRIELTQLNEATDRVREATGRATDSSLSYAQAQQVTANVPYSRVMGGVRAALVATSTSTVEATQRTKDLAAALASVNDVTATKGIKSGNGGSQDWFQQQQEGYQQLLATEEQSATTSAQFDQIKLKSAVEYWTKVSQQANLSSKEELEAKQQLFEAENALQLNNLKSEKVATDSGLASQLASLNAEQAAARGNASQIENIENEKLSLLAAAYGQDSAQYQQELAKKVTATRQAAEEEIQAIKAQLANQATLDAQAATEYKAGLDAQVRDGTISRQEELEEYKNFIEQQNQAQMQSVDTLIQSLQQGTAAYDAALKERAALYAQYQKTVDSLDKQISASADQSAKAQNSAYTEAFNSIGSTAKSQIDQMVLLQQTFQGAAEKVYGSVLVSFVHVAESMLARWSATMLAQTALTGTAAAQQVAIQQASGATGWGAIITWILQKIGIERAANAQSIAGTTAVKSAQLAAAATTQATQAAAAAQAVATSKITAVGEIHAAAGVAAANAYASTAAIPYVGPGLAPGAAAEALATVDSFAGAASLDVGAWNLPSDMPANLHAGEMVVPANFASGLRSSLNGLGSGGGGSTSVTYAPSINATGGLQASDVQGMLNQQFSELVNYMQNIFRNGNLILPGRY